jgi:uncharacterized protein (DUF58 family)
MEWPAPAVAAALSRLRLAVDPRRRRQGAGSRLGSGPGASLEFHDHRAYVPGDDPRQLDWKVYARTGSLILRRHRVEVTPRIELLCDCSASMGLPPAKAALAASLAALLAGLAEGDGVRPAVWLLGERPRVAGRDWRAALAVTPCAGAAGLDGVPPGALLPGAERILISDGLCPAGGPALVRRLGAGAGSLALVQVLARAEADPPAQGAVRLADVEGGAADHVLDAAAVAAYRERFARHQAGWQQALAGRGSGLITCIAEDGLDAAIRRLLAAGLVQVR